MIYKSTASKEESETLVALSRVVSACVIQNSDGKYLLVQEARPKVYGLWNLAAGHVDKGESIEEAAIREAKEETGLEVKLVDKVGVWREKVERPIIHVFTTKIISGKVIPRLGEILDVQWFTYNQVVQMQKTGKLRAEFISDAITRVQSR